MLLWLLLLLTSALAQARDHHVLPGSKDYASLIEFRGGFTPCQDFENSVIDLTELLVETRNKTTVGLLGDIILHKDVDHLSFKISLFKDVNGNWEYLTSIEENELCKHINDEDKPWTSFVKEMEISGCPVAENTYTLKNSTVDLGKLRVEAEHAGQYRAMLEMFEDKKLILCINSVIIVELQLQ